jgi:molecular chaperone Hsp33
MTIAEKIAWDDTILPFQLDGADVRGRVGRLDGTLEQVLSQHNYPTEVESLVAEAVVLTALIGQMIKLRWKLSLQIRGNGPIRLIATDYFGPTADGEPAKIRAFASYDADRLETETGTPFKKMGNGYFAVLIDQGEGTEPYQGITPLALSTMSACAETYFAQSEQLPTRFSISSGQAQMAGEAASHWRAGGVMLQKMPKASPEFKGEGGSAPEGLLAPVDLLEGGDQEDWNRVNILLNSVEEIELIGPTVSSLELLNRLFHEENPRVFDAQPVKFGCTCSPDKVKQSMSIYSAKDIRTMTTDQGTVTADCQFCGAHYVMDPTELGFEAVKSDD